MAEFTATKVCTEVLLEENQPYLLFACFQHHLPDIRKSTLPLFIIVRLLAVVKGIPAIRTTMGPAALVGSIPATTR